ncbi:hypothetical protein [Chitinophaga varians]|uniref:hypothetical protein n=1 Tax=Chitinophaga varians TaxID=2202339 RepID=UPI00165F23E3|nr:hypothetical protein [Chitinophaga varians]MBC9913169.1 hypothetical protein [Chitinophaga varians]
MRGGTVVYKYDQSGQLVHTYKSIRQARKTEKVRHYTILQAIDTHALLNGAVFKMGEQFKRNFKPATDNAPWEGENGMFDVNGLLSMSY